MSVRKIFLVSPSLPSGASWLINCFLELGIRTYRISPEPQMWLREGSGYVLHPREQVLKKWFPVLSEYKCFAFREDLEVEWVHEWPNARFDGAEIIYFIRDPRDSLYSQYTRMKLDLPFREFVRSPDPQTLLGLVDNWRLYNLRWLVYSGGLLFFRFEDYKKNAAGLLNRILDSIRVPVGQEEIQRVVEASTQEKAALAERKYQKTNPQDTRIINQGGKIWAWKEYPEICEVMTEIERQNQDLMAYFGYHQPPVTADQIITCAQNV